MQPPPRPGAENARPGVNIRTLVLLGQQAFGAYFRDNCSQMAAAIAYHILFSIVPLVMFLVSLGALIAGTDRVQQLMTDAISQQFDLSTANVQLTLDSDGISRLESQYGATAVVDVETELAQINTDEGRDAEQAANANTIQNGGTITVAGYPLTEDDVDVSFDNIVLATLEDVVNASGAVSIVSLLVLGYAASGLFGVVRRSLDFVWDTYRHLPMVPGKLFDVAMLFVLVLLVMLVLGLLAAISIASTLLFQFLGNLRTSDALWLENVFWWTVGFALPMLFSFLLFLLLYRYGPHVKNSFGAVWLGALVAALGFEILKFGFSIYVTHFSSYDLVYGALAGVLVFLLFIYLSAQVFLFGAELASEYPRVMRGDYAVSTVQAAPTTLRQKAEAAIRSLFVRRPPP